MSSRTWKVAKAKAQFSQLVRQAQEAPQFVESHGTPAGVMLSVQSFDRLLEQAAAGENKVTRFLQRAEEIRRSGGITLVVARRSRKNPLKASDL